MKDRRVRLRPRDGARQLYYSSAGIVNTRGTNLFDSSLPWLGSQQLGGIAPNFPNIISAIQDVPRISSSIFSNITGTVSNAISNFSISSLTNNLVGRSFGQGQGRSVLGDNVNILEPLSQTDGLVWPYTPTVSLNQSVDYNTYDTVHSNQEIMAYTRTRAQQITISGQFVVQNTTEASYALAAIHFLRTIVKMNFGTTSSGAGTPPPVLILSAYGEYMFNEVPVLVQGYSVDFPPDVDYVPVPQTDTVVPAAFTLSVNCIVQNTPNKLRQFNLDRFRRGGLLKEGGWL